MAHSSTALAVSWALVLFGSVSPGGAETRSRVFVLESEPPGIAAVGLDTCEPQGRVGVAGQPERTLLTPDGSRVVVLDRGPGKETVRFGYHPTGKSRATLIDPASLQEVGRSELCWNVDVGWALGARVRDPGVFSVDGRRLTLPCTGYRSQKPEETLPRQLVNLDVGNGRVAGSIDLPRAIEGFLALPGGDSAVVYSAREAPKDQPLLPAELRFVDLATLEVRQTVALEGDPGVPTLSPEGEYLYLLEYGKPDKKPERNVAGRVQVVSVARRAHEINLDAGSAPRGLVVDKEGLQVFLLSEGAPSVEKKDFRPGELRIIRGPEVAATIEVGEEPLFLRMSPDRESLYVVSEKTLTQVDLPALASLGATALKPAGISLLTSGGGKSTVKEIEFSGDGKRGYVLYADSSKLGVLDLEGRKLVAEITTGRGGVKFGKFLAAAAASAASYSAGYAGASSYGGGFFVYSVYGVAPANTSLVLSNDEEFLYVLNTQSNDVTIVKTGTREAKDKIGVGGAANRLELLPGGSFVAVTTGTDTLHLIDTKTNVKVSELPDGGNYLHSPDKRYAAAIGKGVVYCLDGASLKTLGRATFKKPAHLLFEPPPAPPAAAPLPTPPSEVKPEEPAPPPRRPGGALARTIASRY